MASLSFRFLFLSHRFRPLPLFRGIDETERSSTRVPSEVQPKMIPLLSPIINLSRRERLSRKEIEFKASLIATKSEWNEERFNFFERRKEKRVISYASLVLVSSNSWRILASVPSRVTRN